MPTTHKNTFGGGSASIVTDLGATPVAGDTVELVQGQQAYSSPLNALASVDLAAFIVQASCSVSLGNGNSPLYVDAALVRILGRGLSYALRGGSALSHDRVQYNPFDPRAVAFFSDATCPLFEVMSGADVQVMASYAVDTAYVSGLVGTVHIELGGTDPTSVIVGGRLGGTGPRLLLGRSPDALELHAGSSCELTTDTAKPVLLTLCGGRFVGRGPAPDDITGGGIVDLRQIRTAFAPATGWVVTAPTRVLAPPSNGPSWTPPASSDIHAPFEVVAYGQAG